MREVPAEHHAELISQVRQRLENFVMHRGGVEWGIEVMEAKAM